VVFVLLLAGPPVSASETPVAPRGTYAEPVLSDVWDVARERIYPAALRARFDDAARLTIERRLADGDSLAGALNPFLLSLGVSHTYLYDSSLQGYYFLRSLFTTRDLDSPELYVLGLQLEDDGGVRAVLHGLPADRAGVLRGERIVAVDGRPFASLLDWQGPDEVAVTLESLKGRRTLSMTPRRMGFHRALLEATRNSAHSFDCGESRVGYLKLWSGADRQFLDALETSVAEARERGYAGYVLDLRDGFGGAWWPYLDPFFADRRGYFVATVHSGGAPETLEAEPADNPGAYRGPLAVLINGGTRSGKESLAFQFAKSGRGRLFGATTAGAFSAGQGVFADRPDAGYLLYLAVAEYRLDGAVIEGVGVAPDQDVAEVFGVDAPLAAALRYLGCP